LIAEFSLWSADLVRLADDAEKIARHADVLHIDVADGHFAPALLFFPDLVARIRQISATPIHVHLMVDDDVVKSQIDQFAEAGADLISVHAENANALEALDHIAMRGLKAGLVLKVETPVARLEPYLSRIEFATLLGTAIGVKGQGLHPDAPSRLTEAKALIARSGRRIILAADGGIRENTVPDLRDAGAETVVLGSLAFAAPDLDARMMWLKTL
jgi:ribulose-phosphate 3-epimerase